MVKEAFVLCVLCLRYTPLRPSSRFLLSAVLGLLLKDLDQVTPDDVRALCGVDARPDALLLVVACHGIGLLVVGVETFAQGFCVVIASLDERLASNIVLSSDLRGSADIFSPESLL